MAYTDRGSSSEDLSLKLRIGSSDSSFYMDFDCGIDSDIEDMSRLRASAEPALDSSDEEENFSVKIPRRSYGKRWVGVNGGIVPPSSDSRHAHLPLLGDSPITPHIIVSPDNGNVGGNDVERQEANIEDFSGNPSSSAPTSPVSSPAGEDSFQKQDGLFLNVNLETPILEANLRKSRHSSMLDLLRRVGSQQNLNTVGVGSPSNIRKAVSKTSLSPSFVDWKAMSRDSLINCVSALYGKLLVVMGMAFPMAEVIASDIPLSFYKSFYLYLYVGSIFFLIYVYVFLLQTVSLPTQQIKSKIQNIKRHIPDAVLEDIGLLKGAYHRCYSTISWKADKNDKKQLKEAKIPVSQDDKEDQGSVSYTPTTKTPRYTYAESNHGSMYLKMIAVLFGVGSMIYSGLEIGQYFELQQDSNCDNVFLVLSPAASLLFTFIQMYFIFLNSRLAINKHTVVARFGLMHMIATNLCTWLNVLVQETKHEISSISGGHGSGGKQTTRYDAYWLLYNFFSDNDVVLQGMIHSNSDSTFPKTADYIPGDTSQKMNNESHSIIKRSVAHHAVMSVMDCRRSEIIGKLVDEASPFLFPCTIEYSLLCSCVLYVMWKNINKPPSNSSEGDSDISTFIAKKTRHHYSVDCARASRGLFMGILVLVLTIISLVLFFVLISNEKYVPVAIFEANIIELTVYSVALLSIIIAMIQMKELEFLPEGDIELDNILLLIAQTGVYIYACFTIIGVHFNPQEDLFLPFITPVVTLIQTTLQTIFILDASRRCCINYEQLNRKPGREMVTFLLVCNLAMWAISTFETSRTDAHPTQLNFYGIWAWTIISHVSMPLAIFYRCHVTVCLCEIWKRAYKLKQDYMYY